VFESAGVRVWILSSTGLKLSKFLSLEAGSGSVERKDDDYETTTTMREDPGEERKELERMHNMYSVPQVLSKYLWAQKPSQS
jgi:hypothetical protein